MFLDYILYISSLNYTLECIITDVFLIKSATILILHLIKMLSSQKSNLSQHFKSKTTLGKLKLFN